MNNTDILPLLIISTPVITALTCLVMLGSFRGRIADQGSRSLHRTLAVFFAVVVFNWIYGMMYVSQADLLAYIDPVLYCTYLLIQVMLYRYTFTLTRLPGEKSFSWMHYLLPVTVLLITVVWSFFIPDAQIKYSATHTDPAGSHFPHYHAWVNTRYWVRAILSLVYMILAVRRILRYRREVVNYSADTDRSLAGWLLLSVLITLPMIIIPLVTTIIEPLSAFTSVGWVVPATLIAIQMVVLCYFTLTNYYVIIEDIPAGNSGNKAATVAPEAASLNKKDFEKYISRAKPYLDPMVKITDLCTPLSTNRTYLSAFINKEYGMNFRQYMNSLRLEAADSLQLDSGYSTEEREQLLQSVGFGSMRSYLRAKGERGK